MQTGSPMRLTQRTLLTVLAVATTSMVAMAQQPIGTLHCNDANGIPLTLGQTVTVRGTVTQQFPLSFTRLFLQDFSGGINVFGTPQYCGNVGDDLTVQGVITQFNGLTELASPLVITVNGVGNPTPAPLQLTVAQVRATYQPDDCEPNEGRLVQVESAIIRTTTGAMPSGGFLPSTLYNLENFGPDSTTNFVSLFIYGGRFQCSPAPLVDSPIPLDVVCVTGTISQFQTSPAPFNGVYEIIPRFPSDLVACRATPVRNKTWGQLKQTYR
jgi:hypothetical protein